MILASHKVQTQTSPFLAHSATIAILISISILHSAPPLFPPIENFSPPTFVQDSDSMTSISGRCPGTSVSTKPHYAPIAEIVTTVTAQLGTATDSTIPAIVDEFHSLLFNQHLLPIHTAHFTASLCSQLYTSLSTITNKSTLHAFIAQVLTKVISTFNLPTTPSPQLQTAYSPTLALRILQIIGSGVVHGYVLSALHQRKAAQSATPIADLFLDELVDFKQNISRLINFAFTVPSTFTKSEDKFYYQHTLADSLSWFFVASPSLTSEFLKIAKPLGKTFAQQIVPLTTLCYAANLPKQYSRVSTTWISVLRPLMSSWYVGDIIGAAVVPKEAIFNQYLPFLALLTTPEDLTVAPGVTADLYNPDISASILKTVRIRPATAIPSIIHLLTHTTSSPKVKKSIISTPFLQQLIPFVISEARQTDTGRHENATKLMNALLTNLIANNPTSDFVVVVQALIDVILARNGQTAPTSADQKQTVLVIITDVLAQFPQPAANGAVFVELTEALLGMLAKETSADVKITIMSLLAKNVVLFNTVPVSLLTTMYQLITTTSLNNVEEVTTAMTMVSKVVYAVALPSLNATFYVETMGKEFEAKKDELFVELLNLIKYTAERPALYSMSFALTLLHLTLSAHYQINAVLPDPIQQLFTTATSPLLKQFALPFQSAITSTAQFKTDASVAVQLFALLTKVNNDFEQHTAIVSKPATLQALFQHILPTTAATSYNKYISLFIAIVHYTIYLQDAANNVQDQLTRATLSSSATFSIWFQLAILYVLDKAKAAGGLLQYFGMELPPFAQPTPSTDTVSPYTTQFVPIVPSPLLSVQTGLFDLLSSSINLSETTHFTTTHQIVTVSALLLAARPECATTTAQNTVPQHLHSVTALFKQLSAQVTKHGIDLTAALNNKTVASFVSGVLLPSSVADVEQTDDALTTNEYGLFFTPATPKEYLLKPDLSNISKTAFKYNNTTSPLSTMMSHSAVVFAAFYSTIAPTFFHTSIIQPLLTVFQSNVTNIFSTLTAYHMAVWNTSSYALCDQQEPKELYNDEATLPQVQKLNAFAAKAAKSGNKKGDKAATATPALSAKDEQKQNETLIRANITNAIAPVTVICCLLDYLIYANKDYCRDHLLLTFFRPITYAMSGQPIKKANRPKGAVDYEEIYSITIYKQTCIPLLLSLCHATDSHFSEDEINVQHLKAAIKSVLLTHDQSTHNLVKFACQKIVNIDLTQDQITALKKSSIDSLYSVVDCLSMLSSTTSSLYFTPSSCGFITPLLHFISSNIDIIINSLNVPEEKTGVVEAEKSVTENKKEDEVSDGEDDNDDDDDGHEDSLFSDKPADIRYTRSTLDIALLTALNSVAQILQNQAKPAVSAPDSNSTDLAKITSTMLNALASVAVLGRSTLTNIPSSTTIAPTDMIDSLIDSYSRLIGSFGRSQGDTFVSQVLSKDGLLATTPSTCLATITGLEKSRLLQEIDEQDPTAGLAMADIEALVIDTFALRFHAISDIGTRAAKVFAKFNLVNVLTNDAHDSKYYIKQLIALLSNTSRSVRVAAGLALPYLLVTMATKSLESDAALTISIADFVALINSTLAALTDAHSRAHDVTIKKQSSHDKDKFINNGFKRAAICSAVLQLSTLFSPEQSTSSTPAQFDLTPISSQIVAKQNELYVPLLHRFMSAIVAFTNEVDYDAWDAVVYCGSSFLHTNAVNADSIETFSIYLQDSLKQCGTNQSLQAQKEGLVIMLSALSHHLTSQSDQHTALLQSIWTTLLATIHSTAQPLEEGTQTPYIDSIQKTIFGALVTIARTLSKDIVLGYYQQHFATAFNSKQFAHRVSSSMVIVAIAKALGGVFLLKETTLFQTLHAVLVGSQPSDSQDGKKLDKKQHQQMLADLQKFFPPQGDRTTHLLGTLTVYIYLFVFMSPQMAIQIQNILPKILCFLGSEINTRELALSLSQHMMKSASANLKGGAKIILPLLIHGLRDSAQWRTKVFTLQLLSTIVSFSSKDLSNVLPSIIPRLIELRRDSNKDVAQEAANVLNTLSTVIKNPQIAKIAHILVQALHSTNLSAVTRALESLFTTVFMHYVDPVALAVIMPIVFYGLTNDRSSDLKKVAAQIAGSVSMITSNLHDVSPYMSKLLELMKITLMDSTPEVRNVTAKAIKQMVTTQQRVMSEPDTDVIAGNALLAEFDNLVQLLFDILSQRAVCIPAPGNITIMASDGTTSVQRSGCCYGISNLLHTKPIEVVDNFYESVILPKLSDQDQIIREGFTELMYHIPQIFGLGFAPMVVKVLPVIIGLLGDTHALCRDFAQKSSQVMVQLFATTTTAELLATILEALLDRDYRVRTGATVLAACFLLRLAGVEGEISIAEAEDEAVTAGQIQGAMKEKITISNEKQELSMLEYISVESRNEIYSSLFLMRTDYVGSVSAVAWRVWKAVVPSNTRMLQNILPRLVERITADLASFDRHRQHTAGKALSDLVSKLGDRILRDIIPILLEKFESIDIHTRSGVCLGFSEIFSSSSKGMLSPYNTDIYPIIHFALCDRSDVVRQSACTAFHSYCKAIGADKVTKEIIPLLLSSIDSFHARFETLTEPVEWDENTDVSLERFRDDDRMVYDPAADCIDGLTRVAGLSIAQKLILDAVIPHFIASPITQHHVHCIAEITTVCGKSFNNYLEQVLHSLSSALSTMYRELYIDNDFSQVNEDAVMDDDEDISLADRKAAFEAAQEDREWQRSRYTQLITQEAALTANAFNVFVGLAPQNFYSILDLILIGLGNSNYTDIEDSCAWLKLTTSFWSAICKLNGTSLTPGQPTRPNISTGDEIDLEDFGMNFQQTMLTIIQFFANDEDYILRLAADSLQALLCAEHPDVMLKYLAFIRTQINDISGTSRRTGQRKILELPVLNNTNLVATLLALAQHGLVSSISQPTIRLQCAAILLDIIDLAPTDAVTAHAMKLTGFLIRIFADKISVEIKSKVLTTMALLLKKASRTLKPFHSQLKTTLVKALLTVDVEAEKAAKPILNAAGVEIVSAHDNRNVIQGTDIICERAAFTLSFLSKPETFFADLISAVLLHQHRMVAGKIAKSITQILSDRAQFETLPKATLLEHIEKLIPSLTSSTAHDSVRIEVARIIGILVGLIPTQNAYEIIANLLAQVGCPAAPFPQALVDQGIAAITVTPSTDPPTWVARQSTAMALSSVLISTPSLFNDCVGYRPAIGFIARGFKETNELGLTAVVRFAGRVLLYANNNGDVQIVKMLTQELLNLCTSTNLTEPTLICILTQVRVFAEQDPETANELVMIIVPLCIRARVGAVKSVRKEIDIVLHYALLFNEDNETGMANANEVAAEKFSKADATEFIDICKRSVSKIVEKKKEDGAPEEDVEQQW